MTAAATFAAAASAPADWRDVFQPYSATHAAVFVGFTLGVMALCRWGSLHRGTHRQRRVERLLASAATTLWIVGNGWQFLPRNFVLGESLPLHVCDWMGLVAPAALVRPSRRLSSLVYFYGVGLSTQSFITPVLQQGPAHTFFWIYWLTHAVLVGFPFYLVAVSGFRPTWSDCRFVIGVIFLYAALIIPFDLLFNVNYGYVGRGLPERPTIIEALGSWPWRLAPLAALVCVGLFLPLAPWLALRNIKARRAKSMDNAGGSFPTVTSIAET